jgi:hypothetical protein
MLSMARSSFLRLHNISLFIFNIISLFSLPAFCFYSFTVVNNAALNMAVHISFWGGVLFSNH